MKGFEVKLQFIKARSREITIDNICKTLKISRSTGIRWNKKYKEEIESLHKMNIEQFKKISCTDLPPVNNNDYKNDLSVQKEFEESNNDVTPEKLKKYNEESKSEEELPPQTMEPTNKTNLAYNYYKNLKLYDLVDYASEIGIDLDYQELIRMKGAGKTEELRQLLIDKLANFPNNPFFSQPQTKYPMTGKILAPPIIKHYHFNSSW